MLYLPPQFDSRLPVVAVRALKNRAMDSFGQLQLDLVKGINSGEIGRNEAQIKVEEYWMGALRKAVIDGDVTSGSMMSGQSVGLVKDVKPVAQILEDLVNDTEAALQAAREKLK
jgi:enoyl-[acyl-carrier protein] reductase II